MNDPVNELTLELPVWTQEKIRNTLVYPTASEKMAFVLDLLAAQIEYETGYPFAAAIFDKTHHVTAVGVNNGIFINNSTAHAEMLALQFAQAGVGKPYLPKKGEYTLVASAQPCAMCLGALYASGVRELVIGAAESDIEEILGFGQGLIHPQWREFFAAKGIAVIENVERDRARSLMLTYRAAAPRPLTSHNRTLRPDASSETRLS